MRSWARISTWLPLATLSSSYKGPVVFADETQTIHWFSADADRSDIDHKEHEADPATGQFLFDADKKPRIKTRRLKAAFWAPVEVTD